MLRDEKRFLAFHQTDAIMSNLDVSQFEKDVAAHPPPNYSACDCRFEVTRTTLLISALGSNFWMCFLPVPNNFRMLLQNNPFGQVSFWSVLSWQLGKDSCCSKMFQTWKKGSDFVIIWSYLYNDCLCSEPATGRLVQTIRFKRGVGVVPQTCPNGCSFCQKNLSLREIKSEYTLTWSLSIIAVDAGLKKNWRSLDADNCPCFVKTTARLHCVMVSIVFVITPGFSMFGEPSDSNWGSS